MAAKKASSRKSTGKSGGKSPGKSPKAAGTDQAKAGKKKSARSAAPTATATKPKAAATAAAGPLTYDAIAARAFQIWEAKGRPKGQDIENWREAEAQLLDEQA